MLDWSQEIGRFNDQYRTILLGTYKIRNRMLIEKFQFHLDNMAWLSN